jgi:hypothetical protein
LVAFLPVVKNKATTFETGGNSPSAVPNLSNPTAQQIKKQPTRLGRLFFGAASQI